ncbi:hypothetical protein OFL77_27590, partial [Escherichia coli]|uniref:hypothetical protein n=1 Tax=Escherichia coli TaxID=562 RepID=UPI0021E098AE
PLDRTNFARVRGKFGHQFAPSISQLVPSLRKLANFAAVAARMAVPGVALPKGQTLLDALTRLFAVSVDAASARPG